ncbi:MAG TPA: DUF1080 domain-containing protein [Humisphaera sp.]|nr:DUF1080 domain-containing protein [Humisphaera sp.]
MKPTIATFILCGFFACMPAIAADEKPAPPAKSAEAYKPKIDKDGWEVLFDGKDTSAFDMPANGSWVVTDQGELHVVKQGRNLYTKRRYCDFVIECDFKLAPHVHANSGVLLRVHNQSDPVNTGMEIQILDDADHKVTYEAMNACGALYDMVHPAVPCTNPIGEWNHFKITVNDNIVEAEMNGKAIVKADLNQWTTPHQNPDGKHNKYNYAIGALPREGFIGLQNHGGTPVWFKNVRVKELTDRKAKYTGAEPIKEVLGNVQKSAGK